MAKAKKTETAESAGQCSQRYCSKPAEKDGVCLGCWTAIFGGAL